MQSTPIFKDSTRILPWWAKKRISENQRIPEILFILLSLCRVPLNKRAMALVEKYKGVDKNGRLFPFISTQKYNDAIKNIFTACEINRIVTVLNPKIG